MIQNIIKYNYFQKEKTKYYIYKLLNIYLVQQKLMYIYNIYIQNEMRKRMQTHNWTEFLC